MKYYTVAIVLVLAATAQCGFFSFLLRGAAKLNPVLNVVSTAIDIVDALKSNGQLEKILAATAAPTMMCQGSSWCPTFIGEAKCRDNSADCYWAPIPPAPKRPAPMPVAPTMMCQGSSWCPTFIGEAKCLDNSADCYWAPIPPAPKRPAPMPHAGNFTGNHTFANHTFANHTFANHTFANHTAGNFTGNFTGNHTAGNFTGNHTVDTRDYTPRLATKAQGGDCWANGPENESLCEGHGIGQTVCEFEMKNADGSPACHWGPVMEGDCWANGSENEALCEMHNYTRTQCLVFTNRDMSPACHWGPTMGGECYANTKEDEKICQGHGWNLTTCGMFKTADGRKQCHFGPETHHALAEEQKGDCWANGEANIPICEHHDYNKNVCESLKNTDGSPQCQWGPEMNHPQPGQEQGGDCWANGKENEPLCQGHHYDQQKCATFKNTDGSPKCHWGPEMEENWEAEAQKLIAAVEQALAKNGFTLESFQQQLEGLAKQLMSEKKALAEDSEVEFSTL